MTASSPPPRRRSASSGPRTCGPCSASARSTTARLRASAASSIPVPRPHSAAAERGGQPCGEAGRRGRVGDAHVTADEQVDPARGRRRRQSSGLRRCAAFTSSSVSAGSRARLAEGREPDIDDVAMPGAEEARRRRRRQRSRRAPACAASAAIAEPPPRNAESIWPVTSCGYALTPSAATPWSAAAMTMSGVTAGRGSPLTAAIHMASSSRRPRLPGGLSSCCWRARAADCAAAVERAHRAEGGWRSATDLIEDHIGVGEGEGRGRRR